MFFHTDRSLEKFLEHPIAIQKNRILHNLDKNSFKYGWIVSYAIHLKLIVEIYNDNELFTIHEVLKNSYSTRK
jgi:hypothetical protein